MKNGVELTVEFQSLMKKANLFSSKKQEVTILTKFQKGGMEEVITT
jgi:hypothetical protein